MTSNSADNSLGNLLAVPFDGRIVPHDDDPLSRYSDFAGKPTILYPWSDAGLCHAIRLKQQFGHRGFLRSGLSSSGDGPLPGVGGIVVDFSGFARIAVGKVNGDGGRIAIDVEAGVTTRQLADELIRNNAFLPLGDNPVQSVVASVLSGKPGRFDRSIGCLRDYIEKLVAITPQGELKSFAKGCGEFDALLDGSFGGAIKVITFSAVTAAGMSVELMCARFVYARAEFEAAIRLLDHPGITPGMDVAVHAWHDLAGVIVVSVEIAGPPADRVRMAAVLDQLTAYRDAPAGETATRIHRVEATSPAEIVDLLIKSGLSGSHYVDRSLAGYHYEKVVAPGEFDAFRTSFVRNMTLALAEARGGKSPRVAGSLRLSLDDQQNIVVSADAFLPKGRADAEIRFDRIATRHLGNPVMSGPRAAQAIEAAKPAANLDLGALKAVAPTAARIPGFGGVIYAPGDPDYDKARHQYATSSYPDEQGPTGSMHPCMVAYPRKGSDDVGVAIRYAANNTKKVQARSGGHQYCGLSSGGEDTILLSMDLYSNIDVSEANGRHYATLGAGALLTNIAATFNDNGVTIPHGECPRVAIGGHAQTGGFGHFLRSYGLALDHVYKFDIYQADGTMVTVNRPATRDEHSLYWGVLGGGPGSFGIITEITFEAIADIEHPYSWGYSGAFLYSKPLFRKAMDEIQRWTQWVAASSAGLPPDVDMCMTVVSRSWPIDAVYLLEIVNGNKDGKDDGGANVAFLKTAIDNIVGDYTALPCVGYEGPETLSYMANSFVRRTGTTPDGREFADPYKKRLNCTKQPITTKFVAEFVDLLDRVVNSDKTLLCFQMFIGGGAFASPLPQPPVNAICNRDVVLGIVFDCFYEPGGEAEAEGFQADMQNLLVDYSGTQEIRMLWGTFGDTEITDPAIRKLYYDDATWKGLQQLKKQVDKGDLFHTRFTVQLP